MEHRVQITSTRAVLAAAARRGVDIDGLLVGHGLQRGILDDPDARLPVSAVHTLWEDARRLSEEPELPVYAAIELPWGAYRVIDYLCSQADTLGGALELLRRTFPLVNDGVRVRIEPVVGGYGFALERPDGSAIPSIYVDYALAACVHRMSYVIGAPVHPRVSLRRAAPVERTAFTRAFGNQVSYGAHQDVAMFPEALWEAPVAAPDQGLRAVLEAHAAHLLASVVVEEALLDRVRQAIERGLPHQRVELDRIAPQLGFASRTLQRRLREEGVSWSTLVEDVRRRAAFVHLQERTLSIEEVALLTGYAEVSSFHRAFVRWTGQTPGAWRSTH